jgi:major type 1 subunit fimbrin (pilin)
VKKQSLIAIMLAAAGLIGTSAFAEDGTITFQGTILDSTCTISGGGGSTSSFTVDLGNPQINQLGSDGSVGWNAAPFEINIGGGAGCTSPGATIEFDAPENLVSDSGNLKNALSGSDDAKGVDVQIFDVTANAVVDLASALPTGHVDISAGSATLPFRAQYFTDSASGILSPGAFNTNLPFTVIFE